MPSNTNLKSHICGICSRAFSRSEHLKRHHLFHTKEKPFECKKCKRLFARRDLVVRHQQKVHGSDGILSSVKGKRKMDVGVVATETVDLCLEDVFTKAVPMTPQAAHSALDGPLAAVVAMKTLTSGNAYSENESIGVLHQLRQTQTASIYPGINSSNDSFPTESFSNKEWWNDGSISSPFVNGSVPSPKSEEQLFWSEWNPTTSPYAGVSTDKIMMYDLDSEWTDDLNNNSSTKYPVIFKIVHNEAVYSTLLQLNENSVSSIETQAKEYLAGKVYPGMEFGNEWCSKLVSVMMSGTELDVSCYQDDDLTFLLENISINAIAQCTVSVSSFSGEQSDTREQI